MEGEREHVAPLSALRRPWRSVSSSIAVVKPFIPAKNTPTAKHGSEVASFFLRCDGVKNSWRLGSLSLDVTVPTSTSPINKQGSEFLLVSSI